MSWDFTPIWRPLLPRSLTVLGEVTNCVLHNPETGRFYDLDPNEHRRHIQRRGSIRKRHSELVLCATPEGREMFMLRPMLDAGAGIRYKPQSVHAKKMERAFALYERFTNRGGEDYYNMVVPPMRKPRFCGELVLLRYVCDRDVGEDDERGEDEAEYEHYFEKPGEAPAYAELWSVGYGQFYVPPGPWRVDEWLEYAPPP